MKYLFFLGEFGTGKNFLTSKLVDLYPKYFKENIQVTTRDLRTSEVKEGNCIHLSHEEFKTAIKRQELSNYEFFERTGNYYGNLKKLESKKKINIINGDPERCASLKENMSPEDEIFTVFLTADDVIRVVRYLKRDRNADLDEILNRHFDEHYKTRCSNLGIDPDLFYDNGYKRDPSDLFDVILKKFDITV